MAAHFPRGDYAFSEFQFCLEIFSKMEELTAVTAPIFCILEKKLPAGLAQ